MKLSLTVIEQVLIALGNFLFFILASRYSGSESFGEFAKIFISAQIIFAISSQWIIVPITSTRIDTTESKLYSSSLTRFFKHVFIVPLIASIFFFVFSSNVSFLLFLISTSLISIGLTLFDLLRFYNIRIKKVTEQIKINISRLLISLTSLYFLPFFINELVFIIFMSYFMGLIPALYKQMQLILKMRPSFFIAKNEPIKNFTEHSKTMISYGVTSALFTVVTTVIMTKIGTSALGAVQAFRSLVNWVPLAVQHIETHYSVELISRNKFNFLNIFWFFIFLSFLISTLVFFYFFDEFLIFYIFGSSYIEYNSILTILFTLVMFQSATRILGAQARLKNLQNVFRQQAYILFFSSILFIILFFGLKIEIDIISLLVLMVLIAFIQGGTMMYMIKKKK